MRQLLTTENFPALNSHTRYSLAPSRFVRLNVCSPVSLPSPLADLAAHQHDSVGPPGDPNRAIVFGAATVANDLAEPHWHVGPVSVEPGCQGLGIGTKLLAALCRGLDEEQGIGFLETDKPENVRLYERFGFAVTHIVDILGATVWHMRRDRH